LLTLILERKPVTATNQIRPVLIHGYHALAKEFAQCSVLFGGTSVAGLKMFKIDRRVGDAKQERMMIFGDEVKAKRRFSNVQ
jgi:hypothetical protein